MAFVINQGFSFKLKQGDLGILSTMFGAAQLSMLEHSKQVDYLLWCVHFGELSERLAIKASAWEIKGKAEGGIKFSTVHSLCLVALYQNVAFNDVYADTLLRGLAEEIIQKLDIR